MAPHTKTIYRSLSARVTIFIQVCVELWQFSLDGERYNEKIVHSFLPALFSKWKEAGTNHTVTIVLISRVFYDESEIGYAAGPLRKLEEEGKVKWYKDFYRVITDLEVLWESEWDAVLVKLKNSFWGFQRDILLTHHHHQALQHSRTANEAENEPVRLVGRLSHAHDGPILEALNIALKPTEMHYIDRSLTLTGSATILITPGTGWYKVNKHLLRLTTTRMLDQGFGMDLIVLGKQPLFESPVFCFRGVDPAEYVKDNVRPGPRAMDPLWGGDNDWSVSDEKKVNFWWEPFWISVSFWDTQTVRYITIV
jgi:DEP domain-containing protein 5